MRLQRLNHIAGGNEMQKNHTNVKGNISESAALNAFTKAGFVVSVPFGNGAPYDLIETVYLVPTLGALTEGRLRVSSTKNNQRQNVRWANNFEFETFLKNL